MEGHVVICDAPCGNLLQRPAWCVSVTGMVMTHNMTSFAYAGRVDGAQDGTHHVHAGITRQLRRSQGVTWALGCAAGTIWIHGAFQSVCAARPEDR